MKENIGKIISQIFTGCVFLFMALGVFLVAGQFLSIMLRNGAWCLAVNSILKIWMIRIAATAGILGFIKGYLRPAKN